MADAQERHVTFERCLNFRDLGGYKTAGGQTVRSRRLYRSMTPQFMTPADAERAVNDLGVRRVIDLRDREDVDSGPIGHAPNQRHVVKFAEVGRDPVLKTLPVTEVLPKHLDLSAAAFVEAFELMSGDAEGGIVFHRHTGKDRTGVLAALLLRLLGVDAEDVVADYMLGALIAGDVQTMIDDHGKPAAFGTPASALEPPNADAMRLFLARLEDEFGGARAYLLGLGVPAERIDRFVREMLVAPV